MAVPERHIPLQAPPGSTSVPLVHALRWGLRWLTKMCSAEAKPSVGVLFGPAARADVQKPLPPRRVWRGGISDSIVRDKKVVAANRRISQRLLGSTHTDAVDAYVLLLTFAMLEGITGGQITLLMDATGILPG